VAGAEPPQAPAEPAPAAAPEPTDPTEPEPAPASAAEAPVTPEPEPAPAPAEPAVSPAAEAPPTPTPADEPAVPAAAPAANGNGNGSTPAGNGSAGEADSEFVRTFGTAAPPPGSARPAAPERRPRRPRHGDAHIGVDLALRTLVVPEHTSSFWDDMAERLADEPQLRLRPRAAVRPITQPPPVIDDRLPLDDRDLTVRGGGPRRARRRRRGLVLALVVILAAAVAIGVSQGQPERGEDARTEGTTTTVAPTTVPGAAATVPPSPVDPAAGLTPNGVDELLVGRTMRDLTGTGVVVQVDQPTFDGSGGTCFDGRAQGVGDVLLRFRSPEPGVGVTDPADAVLASVRIDARVGSTRGTSAGVALGAPTDQVRAAYPEGLEEANHPFTPGGLILTIAGGDGNGNGLAFMTDGNVVTSIVAGSLDVIRIPEGCS
jgi:hypothetical protein